MREGGRDSTPCSLSSSVVISLTDTRKGLSGLVDTPIESKKLGEKEEEYRGRECIEREGVLRERQMEWEMVRKETFDM